MTASFLASLVEGVEALTVILAVGSVRGWRSALLGAASAVVVLLGLVLLLGRALTRIPLGTIQLVVGVLLVLFGLRWLRKAILRSAGLIPLHDEEAAFRKNASAMRAAGLGAGWDKVAFGTAFNITMLEGTEVVFIVIAIGAGGTGMLLPAGLGAAAALLMVVILGFALHRPLTRVPENTLKFVVGTLLSAFGTFWVGEGLGFVWPGADWSIVGLVLAYSMLAALLGPFAVNRVRSRSRFRRTPVRSIATIVHEIFGLFVDDGSFAFAVLAWIGVLWLPSLPQFLLGYLGMPRRDHPYPPGLQFEHLSRYSLAGGVLLFVGLAVILTGSVLRFSRKARRKIVPL